MPRKKTVPNPYRDKIIEDNRDKLEKAIKFIQLYTKVQDNGIRIGFTIDADKERVSLTDKSRRMDLLKRGGAVYSVYTITPALDKGLDNCGLIELEILLEVDKHAGKISSGMLTPLSEAILLYEEDLDRITKKYEADKKSIIRDISLVKGLKEQITSLYDVEILEETIISIWRI